jgi:3-hydroxyacyl-CoA dehydrogenase
MSDPVRIEYDRDIAIITADNPPVNALSQPVRAGLQAAFEQAGESDCRAIVLNCAGRTFFAGADISEFGKPPADPWLPQVLETIESCDVPVVAAIHGTALGGGLETAMACHYRIAAPAARVGLPEVTLGLLPGAGGTQWAPRLMGVRAALDLMISGKPVGAGAALGAGLIDRIAEGELLAAAKDYARELVEAGSGPRRTSDLPVDASQIPDDFFPEMRAGVAKKTRTLPAPQRIIDCVEDAVNLDIHTALENERDRFTGLMYSSESAGLRHVFFAERQAAKVEGISADTPLREVRSVGIIGAGTMGGGIAMNVVVAGMPVTVLEINQEALDAGLSVVRKNFERSAEKGRFSVQQVEEFMGRIRGTTTYDDLEEVDLVIEAVFENPDIKCEVFRTLDEACKPGAILASNTSFQDIDAIAAVTTRPQDVLGMHFFSPANVMKLLEVVRGEETADDVLATVMALARRIRKVPVLARVCYGFIGNRMLEGYMRQAQMVLLEGATPAQVDGALERFGMAMGPIAVADLSGLDVGYKARKAIPDLPDHPAYHVTDQLVESGRLGQKTGAGFYRYDPVSRRRIEDPEVESMIRVEAAKLGIEQRTFGDREIVERVVYPLINEGARVLDEGVAQRPGDIDIAYVFGYGFPAHRGGPMFYASTVGLDKVYAKICHFAATLDPDDWEPAPLLQRLAEAGKGF